MADQSLVRATVLPRLSVGTDTVPGKVWYAIRRWPILPVLILVVLVVTGVFAPLIAPHSPIAQDLSLRNAPPAWFDEGTTARILGGDHVGRDILSRVVHGARISLLVVAISLSTGVFIGTSLGLISGYFGGFLDEVIMRMVDVWLALPFILIALVAVIVLGASMGLVMVLLALFTWASFVRFVRAEVLSLKERDYVALAKVSGASVTRIILRHILPGS